jgi:2-polyprenyl-3-methyl-5-hydroxy-6-metoxy-1,4-benzoquinol methylase
MSTETIDQERAEAFVGKAMGDLSATTTVVLCMLGDRLSLFKTLAEEGPATSDQLAQRAGIAERYAREWLAGLAAAGYLDYDPDTTAYTLPAEHTPVVAEEGGAVFFGGVYEIIDAAVAVLDQLAEAYRTGGGVPAEQYPRRLFHGIERFTAGWFNHLLVPVWLPEMPAVGELLRAGADVADVGCGRGKALITLAKAFPASSYVGYDNHGPSVEAARQAAADAGVADRVRFEQRDVGADGLPEEYDVITTFDVIHDAVDPAGMLRSIHAALRPSGRYVCVDVNASHAPEENTGAVAALFYGFSNLYCMTSSLAPGGTGLGTCGFNPYVAEQMCKEAGFTGFRTLPLDNPFNNAYEITP